MGQKDVSYPRVVIEKVADGYKLTPGNEQVGAPKMYADFWAMVDWLADYWSAAPRTGGTG